MRSLVFFGMFWLLPPPLSAFQNNAGGNTAEFLKVGPGARALGFGEAFGPVAEGPEAIYWNPAGLAALSRPELSYTRSEFLSFFHHDFLAYAHPVKALKGTLAASFTRLSQESLPLVTNANVTVGRFNPHSHAVALAYARRFSLEDPEASERAYFREAWNVPGTYRPFRHRQEPWTGTLLLGLSVKGITETLYDRTASAVAVDGGAIFRPVNRQSLTFSFAFRHAGGKEQFIRENENLPAEADFGIAYEHRWWKARFLSAFEFALPYYGNPYGKLGVEYSKPVADAAEVAIRGGYKTLALTDLSPVSGLTFGIGGRYGRFSADFGFEPMAELGQVYRFTLGMRW